MSYQLHYFDNQRNPFDIYVQDDPVRPNIPLYRRYGHNRGVFVLTSNEYSLPLAIACCSFIGYVPENESELLHDHDYFSVAVFYTVWNNCQKAYPHRRIASSDGVGRIIINKALGHIKYMKPFVTRVVTLSPKTEMARKFHLNNGAWVFRENEQTTNYEYQL